MANELIHASQGTTLTQSEFEAVGLHVCNSQATGDLIYASSASQLSRFGIGSAGQFLIVSGGIPAWSNTLAAVTLSGTITGGSQVINSLGHIGIGVASNATMGIYCAETIGVTGGTPAQYGVICTPTINATSSTWGDIGHAGYFVNQVGASNNQNWNVADAGGGFRGITVGLTTNASATGTITGASTLMTFATVNAMTITSLYGLYVGNATGAGTVTNQYGIYFEALTKGATLNYMIHGAVDIKFGMGINIATGKTYQVNAVQVVGARVVNAGIDDAIEAAFGVTYPNASAVLTALQAGIQSHGLITPT